VFITVVHAAATVSVANAFLCLSVFVRPLLHKTGKDNKSASNNVILVTNTICICCVFVMVMANVRRQYQCMEKAFQADRAEDN